MEESQPISQISTHQDKEMVEESSFSPSSLLMQSIISIEARSPKQIYFDKVGEETDKTLADALKSLYEFGFTDFKVNKMLMQKFRDVNIVAEQLLTGALSESQFLNMVDQSD